LFSTKDGKSRYKGWFNPEKGILRVTKEGQKRIEKSNRMSHEKCADMTDKCPEKLKDSC
jgi:hypothetical protein